MTTLALFALVAALPAAAQDVDLDTPARIIGPLAGSYRIGPGVKMTLVNTISGLPGDATYLGRAFFPTREGELLCFYTRAMPIHRTPRRRMSEGSADRLPSDIAAAAFQGSGAEPGNSPAAERFRAQAYRQDLSRRWRHTRRCRPALGDYVHVETLDLVLPAEAARTIAAIETGSALSSGDFYALYVERSPTTDAFTKWIAETRRRRHTRRSPKSRETASMPSWRPLSRKEGKAFWADAALYEANHAMRVYQLCPL